MTLEIRKKLEEMAKDYSRDDNDQESFIDGAEAAWEMATKAERERIAKRIHVLSGGPRADILREIFNPPETP